MATSKTSTTNSKKKSSDTVINVEELKKELTDYIDIKIKDGFDEKLENANKKLIREKNKKIIGRNLIILLLIATVVFLVTLLYKSNYFYNSDKDNVSIENNEKDYIKSEILEDNEPTLDELKLKYESLLDNYIISDSSLYIKDYYTGNLTEELKNYLALGSLDISMFHTEDNYNIINSNVINNAYTKLFNTDYTNTSFKYNNNSIRYISMIDSYISDTTINKEQTNIKREIVNIVEKDNIVITTVEGIVKDSKVYNILTNEEIGEYTDLKVYESKLKKMVYTFNKDKQLISITAKI